jgi:hypothetical protein
MPNNTLNKTDTPSPKPSTPPIPKIIVIKIIKKETPKVPR